MHHIVSARNHGSRLMIFDQPDLLYIQNQRERDDRRVEAEQIGPKPEGAARHDSAPRSSG